MTVPVSLFSPKPAPGAGNTLPPRTRIATRFGLGTLALTPAPALASFLSGETLDTAADWVALFVLFFVPVTVIVVFWLVHILPELIAEKRHHPQKEAITTLCLLSLVFGGMLWPIAWLWAYTRPVMHRLAYGTDRHEDYFFEMAEKAREGQLTSEELRHLKEELDAMEARGALTAGLQFVRHELARPPVEALEAPATAKAQASAPVAQAQQGGAA